MLLIDREMKMFRKKEVNVVDLPLNDLYEPLIRVEEKISSIDKINKKSALSMEILKQELSEKNELINALKRELADTKGNEEKLFKKIVIMLDHLDGIVEFAESSHNEALIGNLNSIVKIIRKELREVGFEEIPTIGEIFNSNIHECVEAVEDDTKMQYEIVGVVRKGYRFNDKVIRIASVIGVK